MAILDKIANSLNKVVIKKGNIRYQYKTGQAKHVNKNKGSDHRGKKIS